MTSLLERAGLEYLYDDSGDLKSTTAWALLRQLGFQDTEDYQWNSFDYVLAGESPQWKRKFDDNEIVDITPYSVSVKGYPKDFYIGFAGKPGCFRIYYAMIDQVDLRKMGKRGDLAEHMDLSSDRIFSANSVEDAVEQAMIDAIALREETQRSPYYVAEEDLAEAMELLESKGIGNKHCLTTVQTRESWKGYLLEY